MNKRKHPHPTDAELEILQVIWESGPSTVKEVNEFLNQRREVGYTTTLKIMQIMYEKGLVTRKKKGKQHVYTSAVTLDDTRQQAIDKVVNTVFQGSAMKLVMQTLGHHKASKQELDEVRKYLESLDSKEKDGGNHD